MHIFENIGIAGMVFASTNVDDFFLLLAFFAERRSRKSQIVLGQYLGIGALVILSLAVSTGALLVPHRWIGLLGIVPLLLGLKELFQLLKPVDPQTRRHLVDTTFVGRRTSLAIAGVTIASGGDNVGVYAPLFATMRATELGATVATFVVLVAVWCFVTNWLVKAGHTAMRHERALKFITPLVLILIGIWILWGVFRYEKH